MVVAEMMNHLPPVAFRKLAELFHCILRHVPTTQEAVVDDWLQVETILLKKLQSVKSPNELRGISILATLRKILSATCILLAEKKTFFPHRTAQYAFTPGRNSLQVLLAIKLLIEKCLEWRTPLIMGSADIWKAYDRLKHVFLINSMLKRGVSRCLIACWIRLYKRLKVQLYFGRSNGERVRFQTKKC
jgi:hypothetical protein